MSPIGFWAMRSIAAVWLHLAAIDVLKKTLNRHRMISTRKAETQRQANDGGEYLLFFRCSDRICTRTCDIEPEIPSIIDLTNAPP